MPILSYPSQRKNIRQWTYNSVSTTPPSYVVFSSSFLRRDLSNKLSFIFFLSPHYCNRILLLICFHLSFSIVRSNFFSFCVNKIFKEGTKNNAFYEILPYGRLSHFTTNSAILDSGKVCIIDFDMGVGFNGLWC